MPNLDANGSGTVPLRALFISLLALLVPVLADFLLPPELLGQHQPLLWLMALVPAFLLAYHKGWRGAATALAAGMVTLSLTQAALAWLGRPVPSLLAGVVVAYLALTLGIGWLAEKLHTDRSQVEDLALTDLLTELPNRRHARVFLENEFAAGGRGRMVAVVLFDLDNFKSYNDRFGHQAGDDALKAFAEVLSRNTRRMNLSARFGGEEFLTVLAGSDVEGAMVFAERVRTSLRTMKLSAGSLTVSAGVAAYHPTMNSPDELLAAADHALYQAKREGRNRVRLFGAGPSDGTLVEATVTPTLPEGKGEEAGGYPRRPEELGKSRPPVTLLPQDITGFGRGRRVLLVEDEEGVRDLVASYLSKEEFQVEGAKDVEAASRTLGAEFDLIVTDLKLPGRWGLELISAAKARWPQTQILVISGLTDALVTAEAMQAGADRFLPKPFSLPQLRAEIQDALARRDRALVSRTKKKLVHREERDRLEETRSHLLRGARAMVDAVETREPFLRGHHQAVTRYALGILEVLDPDGTLLSPASLALGTRHLDVGRIAVPLSILSKTGSLAPEEREEVQGHAIAGRTLLSPLLDDEVALEVVSWHHERWDGDGYPHGLTGESIPLSARIAAVADSLAALTSQRPHRAAFPWEEAVEIILKEAERFDPRVLAAFQEALPRLEAMGARNPADADSRPDQPKG